MNQMHDLNQLRHDLKTCLNQIMGYSDILIAGAHEHGITELIAGIDHINQRSEKINRLINFYIDPNEDLRKPYHLEEIQKAIYIPLMQIISDSRRMIVLFRNQAPNFVYDMEQLLQVANQMHELFESELIDLQIQEISLNQPIKSQEKFVSEILRQELLQSELADIESDDSKHMNISVRILVIDDNLAYHRIISRHLHSLGHSVYCIDSGAKAFEYLAHKSVDIIILDVLMPGMTGYNILRILKRDSKLSVIPVIMISAMDSSSSIAQCINLGAEDYLPKDFDPIILRARLNACIEKRLLQEQQNVFMQALVDSQTKLATELADAARYIVSLLPRPLLTPIKAAVALLPSAQLGGDFCGYHYIDNRNLAIYLLDVSGHGIKSALLAVSLSNTIRTKGLPDIDFTNPGKVLSALNKTFQVSDYQTVFFSLWYGVYNMDTGGLCYASGGSPPACIIRKKNSSLCEILDGRDLVLGAAEDYQYKNDQTMLNKGDRLVLYSDGIYEICRRDGTILGLSEFQKLLPLQRSNPAQNIEQILQTILAMTMNESFQDDVSLLEIQF